MSRFFSKLRSGLGRTRTNLVDGLAKAFTGKTNLDEETIETLEERLIAADVGIDTTLEILDSLRERVKRSERYDGDVVLQTLKEELQSRLEMNGTPAADAAPAKPHVIMVTGVNGVGKTTTIGKLAHAMAGEGKRILLGAADTFRAAAGDQLEIWAKRAGVDFVGNKPGADPSAVAFDSVVAGTSRNMDVVMIDTAGRLHTKKNLMEELKKMRRAIERALPGAPHEALLVMDATTGQNGLVQAKVFHEAIPLSGIALTKLDGTAKGGIVFAIQAGLGVPVRYIGVGEGIDDLQPFQASEYVEALFS